jgi:hypothetical protein
VKNLFTLFDLLPAHSAETSDLPELCLYAVSSRSGADLLPGLLDAIDRASGWVLHRQMTSASALQLHVETQGRALVDLYASLLEQGLHLSRESHLLLSERCSCAYLERWARRGIVSLHLNVSLPAEFPTPGNWPRPMLA